MALLVFTGLSHASVAICWVGQKVVDLRRSQLRLHVSAIHSVSPLSRLILAYSRGMRAGFQGLLTPKPETCLGSIQRLLRSRLIFDTLSHPLHSINQSESQGHYSHIVKDINPGKSEGWLWPPFFLFFGNLSFLYPVYVVASSLLEYFQTTINRHRGRN